MAQKEALVTSKEIDIEVLNSTLTEAELSELRQRLDTVLYKPFVGSVLDLIIRLSDNEGWLKHIKEKCVSHMQEKAHNGLVAERHRRIAKELFKSICELGLDDAHMCEINWPIKEGLTNNERKEINPLKLTPEAYALIVGYSDSGVYRRHGIDRRDPNKLSLMWLEEPNGNFLIALDFSYEDGSECVDSINFYEVPCEATDRTDQNADNCKTVTYTSCEPLTEKELTLKRRAAIALGLASNSVEKKTVYCFDANLNKPS